MLSMETCQKIVSIKFPSLRSVKLARTIYPSQVTVLSHLATMRKVTESICLRIAM